MTIGVTAQPTGGRGVDPPAVVRRLEAAGVPRRFLGCRLANFQPVRGSKTALDAAQVRVDEATGRGLVLTGLGGRGKTHLAVGILAARIEAWLAAWPEPAIEVSAPAPNHPDAMRIVVRPNLAVRFVVVPTLLDRLRAIVRYADADDPLPALIEADLLVLDDLGREKVTDWATERLYVLVNERYNRLLPTVVTTNYAAGELFERGYEALVSRLLEGSDLVRITADDYRIRSASR